MLRACTVRALLYFLIALAASGCSGSSISVPAAGTAPTPAPSATVSPLPLLVPGTTTQYSGSESDVIAFASPTATQPNSNAAYTIAETDTVSAAQSGAPAAFDVHRAFTYTSTTAPSYGIDVAADTRDDYENLTTAANGSQTVTLEQTGEALTGTDETSVLANGGSGAYTENAATTYTYGETLANYPLVTGASYPQTITRAVSSNESVVTGSGTESQNLSMSYQSDDSYTESGTFFNGDNVTITESSNGSANASETGPSPNTETVSVPTNASGTYVIPVTQNGNSYNIGDYYPSGSLPPSPLGSTTVDVAVFPGTITNETNRRYDSNGLTVCRLDTETINYYSLNTGALRETESSATILALTSTGTSSKKRAATGVRVSRPR